MKIDFCTCCNHGEDFRVIGEDHGRVLLECATCGEKLTGDEMAALGAAEDARDEAEAEAWYRVTSGEAAS